MNISQILPFLQAGFYVAGMVAAVVAIISIRSGFSQLGLLKRQVATARSEISARYDRASKERALDLAETYAGIITAFGEQRSLAAKLELAPTYEGPDGDFDYANIPDRYRETSSKRTKSGIMIGPLNKLEGLAANFAS